MQEEGVLERIAQNSLVSLLRTGGPVPYHANSYNACIIPVRGLFVKSRPDFEGTYGRVGGKLPVSEETLISYREKYAAGPNFSEY